MRTRMLLICQSMVPNSRRSNAATKWHAACEINGHEYFVESREGAPFELARKLVAAGIPDQPVEVVALCEPLSDDINTKENRVEIWVSYESLHQMATLTQAVADTALR